MEAIYYPELDERVFCHTLDNGLTVLVVPRPGFSRKLAYFVTDYGSVHTNYRLEGEEFTTPLGVAHFLEHKLFDLPDRDVTGEFAALGAVPNAFTSYDMTAYHFSCTENFEESLSLLLEFVSTPYFTDASVEKEQGIIGQEIDMNEDAPDNKAFELLMKAMYHSHPIREPILGHRDSIGTITPQTLYRCHRAFYAPGNMLLCVVGDVDPEAVCRTARQLLPAQKLPVAQKLLPPEDMTCREHFVSARMDVAMPMFQLGFKCEPTGKGPEGVFREVVGDLAAEVLFGESSALYLQLYEQGLIDASFGGGFETVGDASLLSISGDSHHSEAVRDAILQRARELAREGIEEEAFLRLKRSALGRRIRALDSFDSTCFRLCAYRFSDFDYFRFPGVYRQVEAAHVQEFLQRVVTPERCCLCVIHPNEKEEPHHV